MSDSSVGKESACNAADPGLIPGLGRSAGEGKGYPLQYSGLENSMEVHGVAKSQTTTERLSLSLSFFIYMYAHHIFFNPAIDGHLGCFHVLAIINSGSVEH